MSDGAEGSRTSSAPESPDTPDRESPPATAAHGDEGKAEGGRPRLFPVWILLGAAALSGGAWAIADRVGSPPPPAEGGEVPLITASAAPFKVRPDDPGGMEIPNRGTLIYETLTTADPEEAPERILPPPEEPLSPPQPEPDIVAPPDAPGADATAPQPVEEADPVSAEQAPPPGPETPRPAAGADAPPQASAPEMLVSLVPGVPLPPTKPAASAPVPIEALPLTEDEALELARLEETPPPQDAGTAPLPVFKPADAAPGVPTEGVREANTATRSASAQPTPSNWRYVQLAAADSRSPLEIHWESLRLNHEDVVIGLSPLIMPVDSGESGITYRLRAGPLSDEEAARWVCAQLRARQLDCFVPRD